MTEEERENNQVETQQDELFSDFDITSMSELGSFIEEQEQKFNDGDDGNEEETHQPLDTQQNSQETDEFETESEIEDNTETPPSNDTDGNSSSQLYTAIAKLLQEGGALQDLDENIVIDSPEKLVEVYDQQIKNRIEEYKSNLDPRVKWLQDHIEEGVAMEDLLRLEKDNKTFNSIKEEDLSDNNELQKNIIRQYLKKTTRFSNEKIEKEIGRLDEIGDLEDEAKSSLSDLKEFIDTEEQELIQKAQEERELSKRQEQEQINNFKKQLEDTKEIIPGLPLTKIVRDKIYKTMTTSVGKDSFGNNINKIGKHRMENPLDFEFKLAYLYELTNGFKDWKTLTTPGKKTAITELENAARKMDLQKQTGTINHNNRSSKNTNEILSAMDGIISIG